MSLSIGPPPIGPNDPPQCVYGVMGAARSAPRLTVTTPLAAIVWVAMVSVSLTVFLAASPDDGSFRSALFAVVGVVVGTMLTYTVIVVWLASPFSRRYHWTQTINRYRSDGSETHSLFFLKSRHLHIVREVVCNVSDPAGRKYVHAWRAPVGGNPPIRKGDGAAISYPDQFDAPWPKPGTYRVSWTMADSRRAKPRTLYKGKWKVTD